MDPYRRNPKDIALADGREELRTDRFECEMDDVPWEPDFADEITACDSSERRNPAHNLNGRSYSICSHCGLAIVSSPYVVGMLHFCDEFCKERYAAKVMQD